MQKNCNLLKQLEKATPKCKTSLDCDFNSKKQLTNSSKLNFLHTSTTFHSIDDQAVGQENRAPCEMSSCDSGELLATEMVVTHESDDSASDTGAGNVWSTKQNKDMSWRQNKRKQSRPQRCSTYLRDRNNSLDSAIDLGDGAKDSDDDDFHLNGCHAMDDANGSEKAEENGNDHKFVVTNQTGFPCIFRVQPNDDTRKRDRAARREAEVDSYIITKTDYENGALSAGPEQDYFVENDINMDNVIRIEPQDPESGASSEKSPMLRGDDIEPGEVIGGRAAATTKNQSISSQISENTTLNLSMKKTAHAPNASMGRAPLRHRRTIGELYGLVNPQKRGRGGATNHIAMKYRRDCPIPGCGARYLTNLCDHLKKTHGLGPEERRPWLEKAKRLHQQKQLQEQQQMQQQSSKPTNQQSQLASSISSSTNLAANLAASPALAAIALATSQSTAKMSSTESIAMAMSQLPINRAALLMQQAQALSLLNARAFPNPNSPFTGFPTAQQRLPQPFHNFSPLSGARIRSPWNNTGSRKNCPVPGCGAKSLLNLSDHLSKVHSMTRDERQPWLQRARDETP